MNAKSSVFRAVACAAAVVAIDAEATFTHYSTVRTESGGLVKYELYAHFTGPTDTVLNAFQFGRVSGKTLFHHLDDMSGGADSTTVGTWSPLALQLAGAMDSYLCIGGGAGISSGNSTAADPEWGLSGFDSAQIPFGDGETYGPGWFNQNPPNLQGRVDSQGRVKLGQFVLSVGEDLLTSTYRVKLGYTDGEPRSAVQFADAVFLLGCGQDCNGNGISDCSELANGLATDIDGDGVLDICEGVVRFDEVVTSAFASATPIEVTFTGLSPAFSQGITPRIVVEATADLGAANDALIVQLDGGAGTTLFLVDGRDCPSDPDRAIIFRPIPEFNALIADGELRVQLSAFGSVNTANCVGGGISIRVLYDTLPSESDCNLNGILDTTEIESGALADCNGDMIPDTCQLDAGAEFDCNANGVLDSCDLVSGSSSDLDENGVLDECAGEFIVGGSGFSSIQAAIDAAVDGTVISVGAGLHNPISLSGRSLVIRSIHGPDSTRIEATGERAIRILGEALGELLIQGFTISGGGSGGGGVQVVDASPAFRECAFVGNLWPEGRGAAAECIRSNAEFIDCVFMQNRALRGGAVSVEGSSADGDLVRIMRCTFLENGAFSFAGAIDADGPLSISESLLELNESGLSQSQPPSGAMHVSTTEQVTVSDTRFCRNTPENIVGRYADAGGVTLSQDCDRDGRCDIDEIADGSEGDCDSNGIPDSCDIARGEPDCNRNGVPDGCDLALGTSEDIDGNGVPDDCKVDCDGDGLPDSWEIVNDFDADCDANGILDYCELTSEPALDDDRDGLLDACESARGDFNLDGVVNGADLAPLLSLWGATSPPVGDLDGDGTITAADLAILLGNWGTLEWNPSLSVIEPARGFDFGGDSVTLRGAGLIGVSGVYFDGIAAVSFSWIDARTVVATTPPHAAGTVSVEVRTSVGEAIVPAAFEYIPTAVPTWAALITAAPDPAVVFDQALRQVIISTGWAWRVQDKLTGIEFVLVPPGNFSMGCSPATGISCPPDESPLHTVSISRPFYMSRTEVTQAQWTAVMNTNPSFHQGDSYPDSMSYPVESVSWETIQQFLVKTHMRLPTEAEWEYACRGGTTTMFHGWPAQPSGTDDQSLVGEVAWYYSNSGGQPRPVGTKAANGFGLCDMLGSVWEAVSDWYSPSFYAVSPLVDPTGPSAGTNRVWRGGYWGGGPAFLRCSDRVFDAPDAADPTGGVRVVRNP